MPDRWNKARKRVADAEAELDAARAERKDAREELQNRLDDSIENLTSREREVLNILRERPVLQNKEIAARLNISPRTIKHHIGNILRKFGKQRRIDL